jgi:hypothetical protein
VSVVGFCLVLAMAVLLFRRTRSLKKEDTQNTFEMKPTSHYDDAPLKQIESSSYSREDTAHYSSVPSMSSDSVAFLNYSAIREDKELGTS